MVASHSVENDLARQADFILRLASHRLVLCLFYLHNFTAFVVAAFWAYTVWQARFSAIRTQVSLRRA